MVIVITGNPGVGKHSVSKKLSKLIDYELVDLNQLVMESGIFQKGADSLDVDISQLKKIIQKKITSKSLIVGHLAPYAINKSQVSKAIILRKSPYELLSIYQKRKYSKKKIGENLESEILGIITYDTLKKFGKSKTFQVDTTNRTVSETTKKINKILNSEEKGDSRDWLSVILKKNDLTKFFSY